jgi:hypothetical protein
MQMQVENSLPAVTSGVDNVAETFVCEPLCRRDFVCAK